VDDSPDRKPTAISEEERKSMSHQIKNRADEFRKLALLLSEGDESLSADVVLSEIDPLAYVRAHAEELDLRGISDPTDDLPWIALIDGLMNKGKLIELDWKERGEMFVKAAIKILKNEKSPEQARGALNSINVQESWKDTYLLNQIDQTLAPYGYSIIMIDIYSDCHPIALVRRPSIPAVMETANRIEKGRVLNFGANISERQ
jgi:uncharacterized protein DUF6630